MPDGIEEKETTVRYEKPDSITLTKSLSGKYAFSVKIYSDLSKEDYERTIKRLDDLMNDLNRRYSTRKE